MSKSILAAAVLVLLSNLVNPGAAYAQYFQVPAPYPNPYAPPGYGGAAPVVAFGLRCQSQVGICVMGAPGPVGSACYCMTPYGPAQGMIIR